MPYGPPAQGMPPPGGGAGGQRDRIAQTLMNISQPPPQSMAPQIPQMQMPQMLPPGSPSQGAPVGAGQPPSAMPLSPGMPPMQPQPGMPAPGSVQAMPPGMPGGAMGMQSMPQPAQGQPPRCEIPLGEMRANAVQPFMEPDFTARLILPCR